MLTLRLPKVEEAQWRVVKLDLSRDRAVSSDAAKTIQPNSEQVNGLNFTQVTEPAMTS
ncbi:MULTISPECIES: hypothetical protein [Aerosakkonema]|uniref:hypothetical protein n=1 Tax=Aerosakkonema TaxID=1246629 RepID=UPI0035B9F076